jgi:hypothetical protein
MAQAMQAIMAGGPLPPNCYVVSIPMQQAQQMFPQMMNYAPGGGGAMTYPQQQQQLPYYGQFYQPPANPYQPYPLQFGPYQQSPPSNALVPYSNYYPQAYDPNYNYPVVPYHDPNSKSNKKNRHGKKNRTEPHSNVYNSSSFDTDMRNLSWSRLFGTHHQHRQPKKQGSDQAALRYDQKNKQRGKSSDSFTTTSTTSTSTTSDETIRRVNVSNKQPSSSTAAPSSSSSKQQPKGSLPFKYSSEFVPGTGKQQQQQQQPPPSSQQPPQPPKPTKKETKVKSDDVFVVKKSQPSSSSQQ